MTLDSTIQAKVTAFTNQIKTYISNQLAGKADKTHEHSISEVTNLGSSLSNMAPKDHSSYDQTYGKATSNKYGHVLIEETPTEDSGKAITSGGVYDALTNKADKANGAGQITDTSAYTNLETNANATQHTINTAIDTKIGSLSNSINTLESFNAIEVTSSKGNASADKMNQLYIDVSGNTADVYYVKRSGTSGNYSYSWELLDDDIVDNIDWSSALSDYLTATEIASTYATKERLDDIVAGDIDLTGYIKTSATTGLVKNDGTIDTNTYLTQHQSLTNYIQKSSTTGLVQNNGSIDTNTYLKESELLDTLDAMKTAFQ